MTKFGETRSNILQLLRHRRMTLTDLSNALSLAQSTIGAHLKLLLEYGAIRRVDLSSGRKCKYYEAVEVRVVRIGVTPRHKSFIGA